MFPELSGFSVGYNYLGEGQVFASATGRVAAIIRLRDDDHGMGRTVILEHHLESGDTIYTLYAHLASFAEGLTIGQEVAGGAPLGTMGASGNRKDQYWILAGSGARCVAPGLVVAASFCTGLHFEVKQAPVLHNPTGGEACRAPTLVGSKRSPCYRFSRTSPAELGYLDPAQVIGKLRVVGLSPVPSGDFTLTGSAARVGPNIRLTPAAAWQAGAAWFARKQDLRDGFELTLHLQITAPGGLADNQGTHGADGIAVVVQNHRADALGGSGGAIGYGDIPASLAVEFDTWQNPENGDGDGNHVAILTRATAPNSPQHANSLAASALAGDLNDGRPHLLRVRYLPGQMEVFVDGAPTPTLSAPVDLGGLQGGSILDASGHAWVGVTSATGEAYAEHTLLKWGLTKPDNSQVVPAIAGKSQKAVVGSLAEVVKPSGPGEFHHGSKVAGCYIPDPGRTPPVQLFDIQLRPGQFSRPCTHVLDLVHAGVDLPAGDTSPVHPIADGEVYLTITDAPGSGLGNAVVVRHTGMDPLGDLYSMYLHLARPPAVKTGDRVAAGTSVLGAAGHTGRAFGSTHVHLELRRFREVLFPKWNNIYGFETGMPGRPVTFDPAEFAANWVDPECFISSPAAGVPRASYPCLPGWLVWSASLPGHPRDLIGPATNPNAHLSVYGDPKEWTGVPSGMPLTAVAAARKLDVTFLGLSAEGNSRDEVAHLNVRSGEASLEVAMFSRQVLWLLPGQAAAGASGVAVKEITGAAASSRTWQIESSKVVLRKTGPFASELALQLSGGSVVLLQRHQSNQATDSQVIEAFTQGKALDLTNNPLLPRPVAAFRLTPDGPLVLIVSYSGFECRSMRLFLVRGAEVRTVSSAEAPDFVTCAQ